MPEMKLSGEKYFYGFFYADIEPRNETEYLIGRPITFARSCWWWRQSPIKLGSKMHWNGPQSIMNFLKCTTIVPLSITAITIVAFMMMMMMMISRRVGWWVSTTQVSTPPWATSQPPPPPARLFLRTLRGWEILNIYVVAQNIIIESQNLKVMVSSLSWLLGLKTNQN